MIRVFYGASLLVLALVSRGNAAPAASLGSQAEIRVDEAVREALVANRDLRAALLAIEVARGRLVQAGRLSNPELGVSGLDDFPFGDEGERSQGIALAQSFPVTARLARERDVARGDVRIAEAEVREFARTLVADTLGAFYRLLALDRQIQVNRELVDSFRHVERTLTRRLRAAEVSPAEVSLVRIERLALEQEARRLVMEREATGARLARLMGRPPGPRLGPVGELEPEAETVRGDRELVEEAKARRPDLLVARRMIERAEADRALAGVEVWEDWTLEVSYDRERQVFDAPIGTKRDSFLGVGVTVPLPLWNRRQGRIAAAQAEVRRARRAAEALSLRVEEEVRTALARVNALRRGVEEYAGAILPEVAQTRALFEQGYARGLVGIAELIQSLRQHSEARASYLELRADLRQAAIELDTATGASPYLELERMFPTGGTP